MCSSCLVLLSSLKSDFSSAQGHLFLTHFHTAFHLLALPRSLDRGENTACFQAAPRCFHACCRRKWAFRCQLWVSQASQHVHPWPGKSQSSTWCLEFSRSFESASPSMPMCSRAPSRGQLTYWEAIAANSMKARCEFICLQVCMSLIHEGLVASSLNKKVDWGGVPSLLWNEYAQAPAWVMVGAVVILTKPSCCSVAQSWLTLCSPMDCSTPGFPVLHSLPEFAQTHVHWVSDAT